MTLLSTLLTAALLLVGGLAPWWFVGRASIPARERVALSELGWEGVVATLVRGATSDVWVPDIWRHG